ncbi:hypothetical protein ACMXYN_15120 [Neptuniibacter sp. PT8_73]|uniref:hypothetical protein n=1 Tax=Neptuniibacter sp. PT8_73 TaxID=3398206 RepID=UPI0039F56A51
MVGLKEKCSKYFTYENLICCGESQRESNLSNIPESESSIEAISLLAINILDNVYEQFGPISLTYGFVSWELISEIRKRRVARISPSLDQHSSYELNSRGTRICKRDGLACDFIVHGVSSVKVASWIIDNCEFDRLYFYGKDRPIHVSYGPDLSGKVSVMSYSSGRLIPKTINKERFIEYVD